MIRSFRHRGLKRLYEHGETARVGPDMLAKVEYILAVLDRAAEPGQNDRHRTSRDATMKYLPMAESNCAISGKKDGLNARARFLVLSFFASILAASPGVRPALAGPPQSDSAGLPELLLNIPAESRKMQPNRHFVWSALT